MSDRNPVTSMWGFFVDAVRHIWDKVTGEIEDPLVKLAFALLTILFLGFLLLALAAMFLQNAWAENLVLDFVSVFIALKIALLVFAIVREPRGKERWHVSVLRVVKIFVILSVGVFGFYKMFGVLVENGLLRDALTIVDDFDSSESLRLKADTGQIVPNSDSSIEKIQTRYIGFAVEGDSVAQVNIENSILMINPDSPHTFDIVYGQYHCADDPEKVRCSNPVDNPLHWLDINYSELYASGGIQIVFAGDFERISCAMSVFVQDRVHYRYDFHPKTTEVLITFNKFVLDNKQTIRPRSLEKVEFLKLSCTGDQIEIDSIAIFDNSAPQLPSPPKFLGEIDWEDLKSRIERLAEKLQKQIETNYSEL